MTVTCDLAVVLGVHDDPTPNADHPFLLTHNGSGNRLCDILCGGEHILDFQRVATNILPGQALESALHTWPVHTVAVRFEYTIVPTGDGGRCLERSSTIRFQTMILTLCLNATS